MTSSLFFFPVFGLFRRLRDYLAMGSDRDAARIGDRLRLANQVRPTYVRACRRSGPLLSPEARASRPIHSSGRESAVESIL